MTTPNPTAGQGTQGPTPQYPQGYYTPASQYRSRAAYVASRGAQSVNVPQGVPSFLGHASTMIFAWIVALGIITWDEWHRHHILPRPSRLWYTSLVYGILMLAGMSGPILPLMNALAVGYTIVLAYQLFNKSGQFA